MAVTNRDRTGNMDCRQTRHSAAWGMRFTRITVNPSQMGGVPCIRGLRIPVATVVGTVADEMSTTEIRAAFPDLEAGDIREALYDAAEMVTEGPVLPVRGEPTVCRNGPPGPAVRSGSLTARAERGPAAVGR